MRALAPPRRCSPTNGAGDFGLSDCHALRSGQSRKAIGAPPFAAHSVMHKEEAVRIVMVLHREEPCVVRPPKGAKWNGPPPQPVSARASTTTSLARMRVLRRPPARSLFCSFQFYPSLSFETDEFETTAHGALLSSVERVANVLAYCPCHYFVRSCLVLFLNIQPPRKAELGLAQGCDPFRQHAWRARWRGQLRRGASLRRRASARRYQSCAS